MNPKLHLSVWLLAIGMSLFSCSKEPAPNPDDEKTAVEARGSIVELPAGSVDALEAAIEQAGPNGTVVVKSGMHYESATVTISRQVKIKGEPGAVLSVATQPAPPASSVVPALHVYNTEQVSIEGLKIQPQTAPGGTAVLIQNAPRTLIRNNHIVDHQFSVLIENGSRAHIIGNTMVGSASLLASGAQVHGVVVINGENARVRGNDISTNFFGVWACDAKGIALGNKVHDNFIGLILCKVPDNSFPLPDGTLAGSNSSATQWKVLSNKATGNALQGYLVIDGANNNLIANNLASGNGLDMELAGETGRFGFIAPTSYKNRVVTGGLNLNIKDCGENNEIIGGTLVSTEDCN